MDLTCYTYEGWAPRLRPASHKRDWMEATPERFAYRCLPLAIANAHGWEVLSPVGFAARWTGGPGVEAVEIRPDPGADPQRLPVSLFGHGTVTFHVEGLFRTPPGWNLWVGGAPNAAKDGIAPLGGVIETDWSPYTFTMNWRFTRPGHWIRFEENEPFCFLFPVERNALTATEARLRPIDEVPELKQAFETWSRSRDAFQKWVDETKPTAPADKWQKLYYRGVGPDEAPGPADHVSKLRLPPFVQADGRACPHYQQAAAAAPPPPPPEPAAPAPDPAIDLALRRRDWIMQVAERQRLLSPAEAVPRIWRPSANEFLENFYAPSRPVVIEGAMEGWPALARWTPDYLARTVGAAPVTFQGDRDGDGDFELYKDNHARTLPFDQFIARIAGHRGNDAYLTAYNSAANREALRPLENDLGYLDDFLTRQHGMIWIGPAGTFTPLHFDLTNNLLAQVVGRKVITLLPPSETPRLANTRHVFSDVHDVGDVERLKLYPDARFAARVEVTLSPGELLYIPVGWWHQVRSLDFSVMLTYTNFHWANDAYVDFPAA
ncbi:cupin-like protein [Zavarzinia compransoris]|nr:cupin-like protein [Zavarzinia compransoris]